VSVLRYIETHPLVIGSLLTFCFAFTVFVLSIRTHWLLSRENEKRNILFRVRQRAVKPWCLRAAKVGAVSSLLYMLLEVRWIIQEQWELIGSTDDLLWCLQEISWMLLVLIYVKISLNVVKNSRVRRRNDGDCAMKHICIYADECMMYGKRDFGDHPDETLTELLSDRSGPPCFQSGSNQRTSDK
jgi:hypothetical protein